MSAPTRLALVPDATPEERIAALEHDYGVLVGTVQQMQKEIARLTRTVSYLKGVTGP